MPRTVPPEVVGATTIMASKSAWAGMAALLAVLLLCTDTPATVAVSVLAASASLTLSVSVAVKPFALVSVKAAVALSPVDRLMTGASLVPRITTVISDSALSTPSDTRTV